MQRYHGFSFAEVMFAVAILGVGFIMVASVFPVAAQQTRTTNDESVAAQIARSAFQTIQSSTTALDYLADGNTHAYGDGTALSSPWEKLRSSMILPTDRRYAWVPFYTKPSNGGSTRFTVLVVRRSLHDSYQPGDTDPAGGELMPQNVSINQITLGDGGAAIAQITRDPLGTYTRVGPGAYLIVTTSSDSNFVGHALQVSEFVGENQSSVFWKLMPGYGINPNETCGACTAGVIGKDLVNTDDQSIANGQPAQFGGTVQDVSVFSAYLEPK